MSVEIGECSAPSTHPINIPHDRDRKHEEARRSFGDCSPLGTVVVQAAQAALTPRYMYCGVSVFEG